MKRNEREGETGKRREGMKWKIRERQMGEEVRKMWEKVEKEELKAGK